jgi:hypothetical protein
MPALSQTAQFNLLFYQCIETQSFLRFREKARQINLSIIDLFHYFARYFLLFAVIMPWLCCFVSISVLQIMVLQF